MINPDEDLLIFKERKEREIAIAHKASSFQAQAQNPERQTSQQSQESHGNGSALSKEKQKLEEEKKKLEEEKKKLEESIKEKEEEAERRAEQLAKQEAEKVSAKLAKEKEAKLEKEKAELEKEKEELEKEKAELEENSKNLQGRNAKGVHQEGKAKSDVDEAEELYMSNAGIPTNKSYQMINEVLEIDGQGSSAKPNPKKERTKEENKSKELAAGLSCIWHPWRPAYAICAICHRPFCFEDLVEFEGKYYCLEDIDKVSESEKLPGSSFRYFYAIAGMLFALPLILFLYGFGGSMLDSVSLAQRLGFFEFLNAKYLSNILEIFSGVLMLFSFVAAALSFANSKKAMPLGIIFGSAIILLFGYEYLQTSNLYYILISIVSLAGIGSIIYARFQYTIESVVEEKVEEKEAPELWPNAERF
ncbi:MAG: hypothetical protein QXS03_02050 [Candidatus Micrarchaeaceae archaeon]